MVLAAGLLLILLGGLAAAVLRERPEAAGRAVRALFVAGAVMSAAPAFGVLGGGEGGTWQVSGGLPGGPWVFGLDALTAVFTLAILGISAVIVFYAVPYFAGAGRARAGAAHLLVTVLVVAMVGVVLARSVLAFLIAWETMALAGWALIVLERERLDVRRAGLLYLAATHTGTLALFGLFAHWGSGATDLTFASLAEAAAAGRISTVWVALLALFGFGMKAGVVPLHFWLPAAHSAAPSPVSALLSGLMIKLGIYGLMRVIVLAGAVPAWWGWLLLGLGVLSGVPGVIWALAQHEIKRLLAFHSVENIGLILLGLGAGVLGAAYGAPAVAVLGYAGAVLHVVNHALFKSLLFLGAGSVVHATGVHEIDRLGGLAKAMPWTAGTFLIGSAAIVGLPPLNGFVSEWLIFRSLLGAGTFEGTGRVAILVAAVLGLIGALALACFAKVFAAVFLGTRREAVAPAHEAPGGMVGAMLTLSLACLAVGLLPVLILPGMLRAGAQLAAVPYDPASAAAAGALPITILALVLTALAVGVAVLVRSHRAGDRRAVTWGCGYPEPTARMQYTASSFAAPLLFAFRAMTNVRVTRTADTYATHGGDPVLEGVVLRLGHWIRTVSERLRPIQQGRLSLYLVYIVVTALVLLGWLLVAGGPA